METAVQTDSAGPRGEGSRRLILLFSLLAAALSLFATLVIYRSAPVTSDENSYEFQARIFAEGRLRRPYPELARSLAHYMIITDQEHGWLSRYSPGHALWLTPGAWLGWPRAMVPLAAALGCALLCLALRRARTPAWIGGALLLMSPYFINIFGTLLSHTSGFLFAALLLYAHVSWKQTGRRRYAGLAGLAWSWLFLNRTYTAALMAVPFGLDALHFALRRGRDRRLLEGAALFAGAAALGLAAYLGYNRLAVGNARLPTFLYYDDSEGLGFGLRHTGGLAIRHTPRRGLRQLGANLLSLDHWLWGFRGSLAAALIGLAAGWNRRWHPVLLGASLAVWAGYLFFWFPGIEEVGGPVYFFETLPFLLFLSAQGFHRIHETLREKQRWGRAVVPLLMMLAALQSGRFLHREIPRLSEPQIRKRVLMDTVRSAPSRSVIFMERIAFPRSREIVFNPRGMESERLLLHGLGEANIWLWKQVPDRRPFLLDGRAPDQLVPLAFEDIPSRISWEAAGMHRRVGGELTDDSGRRVRAARAGSPAEYLAFGRYLPLTAGRYRAFFELSGGSETGEARLDVATAGGRTILAEETVYLPPGSRTVHELSFELESMTTVEPRVYYLGRGDVRVAAIGLEECSKPPVQSEDAPP